MNVLRCALVLALVTAPALAQQGALQPGEYLDGAGGVLVVKPGKDAGLPFDLQTVGANKHACAADGVIGRNGQANLKPDGGGTCILVFTAKPDGVEVTAKNQCGAYCGARATLDGMFFKPQPGCERAAVRKTRGEFKKLYDKKAYAEARAALEPVLMRCTKTLDLNDDGWIRNDLALTHLRLGSPAQCRKLLEPLAQDAAKTDETVRKELPPADADSLIPILRATRTNLKLCKADGPGKK